MGGAFVIDWRLPGIQSSVSAIEAMEQPVCGAGAESPENTIDAILVTQPDLVIAWANRNVEWTLEVLRGLNRVVAHATGPGAGGGTGAGAAPTLPPFLFIDAPAEVREELERWAPRATFTTTNSDLQSIIKKAKKGK